MLWDSNTFADDHALILLLKDLDDLEIYDEMFYKDKAT